MDAGHDARRQIEEALNERTAEVEKNRVSKEGEGKLWKIIRRYKSVFRLKLGSGGAAKIMPMKLRLDEKREPLKVKVRKYLVEQKKFVDKYHSKMLSLHSIKPYSQGFGKQHRTWFLKIRRSSSVEQQIYVQLTQQQKPNNG